MSGCNIAYELTFDIYPNKTPKFVELKDKKYNNHISKVT